MAIDLMNRYSRKTVEGLVDYYDRSDMNIYEWGARINTLHDILLPFVRKGLSESSIERGTCLREIGGLISGFELGLSRGFSKTFPETFQENPGKEVSGV